MDQLTYRQYRWQRILQRVPASAAGSALFSKFLHYVDRPLMRASGERISTPALLLGVPTVMLTTTGAKSGQLRRTPVVGAPDGENIILVASNWGKPRNPGWSASSSRPSAARQGPRPFSSRATGPSSSSSARTAPANRPWPTPSTSSATTTSAPWR